MDIQNSLNIGRGGDSALSVEDFAQLKGKLDQIDIKLIGNIKTVADLKNQVSELKDKTAQSIS
jgi:methyl coenzyme M reductase subunit D